MSPKLEAVRDQSGVIIPDEYFLIKSSSNRPGCLCGYRIAPKKWGFKEQDARLLDLNISEAAASLKTTTQDISKRLRAGELIEW